MAEGSPPQTVQEQARLLTSSAIAAYKAGRRDEARGLLSRALHIDPQCEQAWLWLAGAVDDQEQQRYCLERVLMLNPGNGAARRGLAAMLPPDTAAAEPAPAAAESVAVTHIPTDSATGQAAESLAGSVPAVSTADPAVVPATGPAQPLPARPATPARGAAPARPTILVPARPWMSIILQPRWTIGRLAVADPDRDVLAIAIIVGYGVWLAVERYLGSGDHLAPHEILGFGLLMGPLLGLTSMYLGSKLLALSGGWLGGCASARSVRTALAWAATPLVWAQLLWLPLILVEGSAVFRSTGGAAIPAFQAFLTTLAAGFVLWAFVLLLLGLSEVQRFSPWRAFASLLIGALVLVGPIIVVMAGAVILISLRGG